MPQAQEQSMVVRKARDFVQSRVFLVVAVLPLLVLFGVQRTIAIFGAGSAGSAGRPSTSLAEPQPNPTTTSTAILCSPPLPSCIPSGAGAGEEDQDLVSGPVSMAPAATSVAEIASSLLARRDLELVSCRTIQSLWAGYGHICAVQAAPRTRTAHHASGQREQPEGSSLILKYISPPASADVTDEGHIRKVLSYQVEQYFYTHLAPLLPDSVAVAECIASINDGQTTALVLKDLKSSNPAIRPSTAFPIALEKRGQLSSTQTFAALDWLAGFHGFFSSSAARAPRRDSALRPPLEEAARQMTRSAPSNGADRTRQAPARFGVEGVWLNGGYTYLATRRAEYENLERDQESEWSAVLCAPSPDGGPSLAERVASYLAPTVSSSAPGPASEFETLIHGDVKSENMFASADGRSVAFVDFQYVGLGLGVCDLAKLFTCSVPLSMLVEDRGRGDLVDAELDMQPGERKLLSYYLRSLKDVNGKDYPWDLFAKHWEAALVDWLRFQASWGFWGNTEWLEARVRHIIKHIDI
ncbi:kinase-like domain-containing protein [Pestalotiopsis sp. NC0098]|nr:kinase-like domain-containing protein [Pestalotiopsis sp. NC0098]